jgi:hypothetical protein
MLEEEVAKFSKIHEDSRSKHILHVSALSLVSGRMVSNSEECLRGIFSTGKQAGHFSAPS